MNRLRYPTHPCLKCGKDTTRKNYCDPCLKIIKRPQFVMPKPTLGIFAEVAPKTYRRHESVNKL